MLNKCKYCKYLYQWRTNDDGSCGRPLCQRAHNYIKPRQSIKKPSFNSECKWCGLRFHVIAYDQVFCSSTCMRAHCNSLQLEQLIVPTQECEPSAGFHSLKEHVLRDEHEFEKWFEFAYKLFGVKRILKIDRWFPDVHAEMMDGSLQNIELEYYANSFKAHNHNPSLCNMVISYLKLHGQTDVCGVPVKSVFEINNFKGCLDWDYDNMKLSKDVLVLHES